MKKKYIIPRVKDITIGAESLMIETSNVEIGGKTDRFDSKRGRIYFEDFDEE